MKYRTVPLVALHTQEAWESFLVLNRLSQGRIVQRFLTEPTTTNERILNFLDLLDRAARRGERVNRTFRYRLITWRVNSIRKIVDNSLQPEEMARLVGSMEAKWKMTHAEQEFNILLLVCKTLNQMLKRSA